MYIIFIIDDTTYINYNLVNYCQLFTPILNNYYAVHVIFTNFYLNFGEGFENVT